MGYMNNNIEIPHNFVYFFFFVDFLINEKLLTV